MPLVDHLSIIGCGSMRLEAQTYPGGGHGIVSEVVVCGMMTPDVDRSSARIALSQATTGATVKDQRRPAVLETLAR